MRRAPCFLEVVVRVFVLHTMFVAMIALRIFTMQDEIDFKVLRQQVPYMAPMVFAHVLWTTQMCYNQTKLN